MDFNAATLYEQHRQRIYHLCLRFGAGNIAWAEDAMQDVFVTLLEQLDGLKQTDDLGGWLYRVTANTCLTRLKRQGSIWGKVRRSLMLMADSTSGVQTPERIVAVRGDLQRALSALQALPAKERMVFCMKVLDDLPQQEIAQVLGLSKGYVSKLIQRAETQLQHTGWQFGEVS